MTRITIIITVLSIILNLWLDIGFQIKLILLKLDANFSI